MYQDKKGPQVRCPQGHGQCQRHGKDQPVPRGSGLALQEVSGSVQSCAVESSLIKALGDLFVLEQFGRISESRIFTLVRWMTPIPLLLLTVSFSCFTHY